MTGVLVILQASTLRREVFPAPEAPKIAVIYPPGHIPVISFNIVFASIIKLIKLPLPSWIGIEYFKFLKQMSITLLLLRLLPLLA